MPKEIIQFDQAMFESRLDRMVRKKVEQTIDLMLDAEVDEIANAARYERSGDRKAFRAGLGGQVAVVVAGDVRKASRRRSWRCTWPASPRAAWTTSANFCGATVVPVNKLGHLYRKAKYRDSGPFLKTHRNKYSGWKSSRYKVADTVFHRIGVSRCRNIHPAICSGRMDSNEY